MTAQIFELARPARLECSACGASADAACKCGVSYVPAELAAAAIALNPEKSDRSIAAAIGVNRETVGRARKQLAGTQPVEKRIGKDGKARRLPKPKPAEIMPTQEEADESYQQAIYDHVCLSVDKEMSGETRQRFFAHLKRKYHVEYVQSPAQRGDKGLSA